MIQAGLIPNAHDDLLTDASYDYYGLRLATCSLDQRIKVWKLNEADGTWTVEDDWKAHDAPISKVSWVHPEFGTIIASCSFDRTVKIWEQASSSPLFDVQQAAVNGSTPQPAPSRWAERAMLPDAKASVRAVEFAPHQIGLKLATISSDNHLRIYECLEPSTLTSWQLTEEVDVTNLPTSPSPSYLSRSHTVAVATPTQTSSTLDSASATQVVQALQQNLQQGSNQPRPGGGNKEADGGWCLSWCKERYWGEVLAVGCGTSGIVKIVQVTPSRRPTTILSLDPTLPTEVLNVPQVQQTVTQLEGFGSAAPSTTVESTATSGPPTTTSQTTGTPVGSTKEPSGPASYAITSVSWAPCCGRSYHLVATGGRDGRVRIWRVRPAPDEDTDVYYDEPGAGTGQGQGKGEGEGGESEDGSRWSATVVADFDHHRSTIGRVEWNVTGFAFLCV
ncbi:hypothetical protein AX15_007871 [Amanita polypyramis BW_CC]|nr:hypothetical protein AX15_007871 [Amanita polypyramis BW_CC]